MTSIATFILAMAGPQIYGHLTIVRRQIFGCLKLQNFFEYTFPSGETEVKLIDTINKKTIEGKGEITCYEQF